MNHFRVIVRSLVFLGHMYILFSWKVMASKSSMSTLLAFYMQFRPINFDAFEFVTNSARFVGIVPFGHLHFDVVTLCHA
jgi:hypothetical protein